jgi:HlyD family secretion protein
LRTDIWLIRTDKMKHRYIWLVLLLAACKGKDPSTFPVRKDLTQAVYASGRIYPLNSYKVFSKIPGYVQEIHVGVGDHVKAGQALLTIRNEQSDINVGIARNTMELAAENAKENSALMEALKQEVASAKARYELDSSNFMRYRNLEKANAVSRQAFDQARTQYDISRQGYLRARSNLESTWQRLVLEYRNAQSQYQAQLTNKKEHTLYATINGMVYDLGVKDKGELVSPQQALLGWL